MWPLRFKKKKADDTTLEFCDVRLIKRLNLAERPLKGYSRIGNDNDDDDIYLTNYFIHVCQKLINYFKDERLKHSVIYF